MPSFTFAEFLSGQQKIVHSNIAKMINAFFGNRNFAFISRIYDDLPPFIGAQPYIDSFITACDNQTFDIWMDYVLAAAAKELFIVETGELKPEIKAAIDCEYETSSRGKRKFLIDLATEEQNPATANLIKSNLLSGYLTHIVIAHANNSTEFQTKYPRGLVEGDDIPPLAKIENAIMIKANAVSLDQIDTLYITNLITKTNQKNFYAAIGHTEGYAKELENALPAAFQQPRFKFPPRISKRPTNTSIANKMLEQINSHYVRVADQYDATANQTIEKLLQQLQNLKTELEKALEKLKDIKKQCDIHTENLEQLQKNAEPTDQAMIARLQDKMTDYLASITKQLSDHQKTIVNVDTTHKMLSHQLEQMQKAKTEQAFVIPHTVNPKTDTTTFDRTQLKALTVEWQKFKTHSSKVELDSRPTLEAELKDTAPLEDLPHTAKLEIGTVMFRREVFDAEATKTTTWSAARTTEKASEKFEYHVQDCPTKTSQQKQVVTSIMDHAKQVATFAPNPRYIIHPSPLAKNLLIELMATNKWRKANGLTLLKIDNRSGIDPKSFISGLFFKNQVKTKYAEIQRASSLGTEVEKTTELIRTFGATKSAAA